jgi:predicted nucleic acid-binding protein
MERVFVDTSAWFALANRDDPDRDAVRTALREFAGRCVSSNFVFDETVTLCRYRFGHEAAVRWGKHLLEAKEVDLVRVTAEDEQSAWRLFSEREDKAYSFTDCTSFVLMRRLRLDTAVAVDADFNREGFRTLP